jgi:hypothetical protein
MYNRILRFTKLCVTKVLLESWQLLRHSRNLLQSVQHRSFITVFTKASTGLYLDPQKSPTFTGSWRKIRSSKHQAYASSPMRCTINIHDVPWDPSEHTTTHHIMTVWTAEYLIHCDIEDEVAYAPRMDTSSDKTTRHHNPDDKHLKIHHHKKCVAMFMSLAGTKIVYDSRYMFGSPLNLITDMI